MKCAEEVLGIGQLAARTGVTAETIRYYERAGVVPRAVRRGTGRYRQYDEADVERLRFIRHARELGFGLDEVRELLSLAHGDPTHDCADVNRIARAHLAQVESKLAQLTALQTELARVIGACERIVPVADCRILEALSTGSSPSAALRDAASRTAPIQHARR
jgi:DNA-binding transcriptional MerR regulator